MIFRTLITALTLLLISLHVFADDSDQSSASQKTYQIEMIIFSQINKTAIDSEEWPPTDAFILPDTKVATLVPNNNGLDAPTTGQNQIQLLPTSKFKLNAIEAHLDRSPNYKPIMHIAWLCSFDKPVNKLPIHIQGGQYYNDNGSLIDKPTTDDQNTLIPQVDGLVSIKLNRFFDVTANLVFSAPLKQIASIGQTDYFNNFDSGLLHFHLLQSRRMRSSELNYIDFPLYGIVMEVFPVKNS